MRSVIVRWAIRRVEQVIHLAHMPRERENLELELQESDLPTIAELASAKTCDYQVTQGRDLFCSAAYKQFDKTIVSEQGARALAPTSRPLCRSCQLPNTDHICSHLLFPNVAGSTMLEGSGDPAKAVFRRRLMGAFCDMDESCIENGANCRPGGNPCWERMVLPATPKPALRLSPRELPVALDFLDVTWRLVFRRPLIRLRSVESIAGLVLPCSTAEEFAQRLSEFTDVIKLMDIPDELLPDEKKTLTKGETLNRLGAALAVLGNEKGASFERAIRTLQAINRVRSALQHSAASRELPLALAELGIPYPIEDHGDSWEAIRDQAVRSLTTIRKTIQSAGGET